MYSFKPLCLVSAIWVSVVAGPALFAVTTGLKDTFENGTTEGWAINLAGFGVPPPEALPKNVGTGGPAGVDDAFLLLNSTGTWGPGGRLTAGNVSQWTGDYIAAGVTAISMDVRNFGSADISLRLMFSDAMGGAPTNVAFSTNAIFIPSGGGWTSVELSILTSQLTSGIGSVEQALMSATELRLYHSFSLNFPEPGGSSTPPIAATLGLDNIEARSAGVATVPDSGSGGLLLGLAFSMMALARRNNRSSRRPA